MIPHIGADVTTNVTKHSVESFAMSFYILCAYVRQEIDGVVLAGYNHSQVYHREAKRYDI